MPRDEGWKELGRDLHSLGVNSVDIPKKLYEMGWRKTGESTRKIGAIHSNTVVLPHKTSDALSQVLAAEQARRIPKHRG